MAFSQPCLWFYIHSRIHYTPADIYAAILSFQILRNSQCYVFARYSVKLLLLFGLYDFIKRNSFISDKFHRIKNTYGIFLLYILSNYLVWKWKSLIKMYPAFILFSNLNPVKDQFFAVVSYFSTKMRFATHLYYTKGKNNYIEYILG